MSRATVSRQMSGGKKRIFHYEENWSTNSKNLKKNIHCAILVPINRPLWHLEGGKTMRTVFKGNQEKQKSIETNKSSNKAHNSFQEMTNLKNFPMQFVFPWNEFGIWKCEKLASECGEYSRGQFWLGGANWKNKQTRWNKRQIMRDGGGEEARQYLKPLAKSTTESNYWLVVVFLKLSWRFQLEAQPQTWQMINRRQSKGGRVRKPNGTALILTRQMMMEAWWGE